jgi:hypothetical protein
MSENNSDTVPDGNSVTRRLHRRSPQGASSRPPTPWSQFAAEGVHYVARRLCERCLETSQIGDEAGTQTLTPALEKSAPNR